MAVNHSGSMRCSRLNPLPTLAYLVYALVFISFAHASPIDTDMHVSRATVPKLRILPLGDSITYGYKSSDGNGYRKQMVVNLNETGAEVSVVGSHKFGTMWDPWNAGYSGYAISQIQDQLPKSTPYRPNVILIHAGTNDFGRNPLKQPYDQAINRLSALVDAAHNACPDAVILLAQIIGCSNADVQARIDAYNKQIPGLVSQKQAAGYKILTVNMTAIKGQYLKDGVHPTDKGYAIMGYYWNKAVRYAQAKGLVQDPVTPDPGLDNTPSPPSSTRSLLGLPIV